MRSLDVRAVGRLDLGDVGPQGQSSSGSKSSRDQGVDGLARCNPGDWCINGCCFFQTRRCGADRRWCGRENRR